MTMDKKGNGPKTILHPDNFANPSVYYHMTEDSEKVIYAYNTLHNNDTMVANTDYKPSGAGGDPFG